MHKHIPWAILVLVIVAWIVLPTLDFTDVIGVGLVAMFGWKVYGVICMVLLGLLYVTGAHKYLLEYFNKLKKLFK